MRRSYHIGLLVGLLTSLAVPVAAQDESDDRGSRATRKKGGADLDLGYRAALFAGVYAQDPRFGPLADLGVDAGIKKGEHRWSVEAGYLYEPFSTKSFNFSDENLTTTGPTAQERLVQSLHELSLSPRWRAKWSSTLRTKTSVDLDARFTAFPSDKRLALRVGSEARWGKLRGVFADVSAEFFAKKYPNYLVADRRIDQRGADLAAGGGWVFDDKSEVALHYLLEVTDYVDARYDALDASSAVVRATKSKDYISHAIRADGEWRATDWLRIDGRYEFEINDSVNYDRDMTGRDAAGALESRFIRDYYDYTRHKLQAGVRLAAADRLSVELLAEYWFRDFKTYEARDVDNAWTGELRHDNSVEVGLEAAYQLFTFGHSPENAFFLTAFSSHVHRDSNMKRELSFATNYDITRAFVGVELKSQ